MPDLLCLTTLAAPSALESFLLESSHATSYVLVALLLLSSGVGAPIPEDIPLLFGGWLCDLDQAHLTIMMPVAWFFVLMGDCILYVLGRRYGHHVPRIPGLRKVLTPRRIERAEHFMQLHGGKTLFCVRFLAAVRATTWFAAGALKYPFWKFLAYDGAAAAIFVPALVLLGLWLGPHSEAILPVIRWVKLGLTAAVLLVIVAVIFWHLIRWRHTSAPVTAGKAHDTPT